MILLTQHRARHPLNKTAPSRCGKDTLIRFQQRLPRHPTRLTIRHDLVDMWFSIHQSNNMPTRSASYKGEILETTVLSETHGIRFLRRLRRIASSFNPVYWTSLRVKRSSGLNFRLISPFHNFTIGSNASLGGGSLPETLLASWEIEHPNDNTRQHARRLPLADICTCRAMCMSCYMGS